jgi:hypothetical protein
MTMDLAKELNDALFGIGDEPGSPCARIAFMGEKNGDGYERDLGGMCKKSLESWFREELDELLWDRRHYEDFADCEQETSHPLLEKYEFEAAAKLCTVLTDPTHAPDCAIAINARHGCTCDAAPEYMGDGRWGLFHAQNCPRYDGDHAEVVTWMPELGVE